MIYHESDSISENQEELLRRKEIASKMIDDLKAVKRIIDETESPKRPTPSIIALGAIGI
jgi:hypothetical protein